MKAGAEVDREMKSRVIDKKDTSEKETGRISELNDFYVVVYTVQPWFIYLNSNKQSINHHTDA